jgi:hypothetical protein
MKLIIPKENQKKGGVYSLKSELTGDIYIGSTKCFIRRFAQHLHIFNSKQKRGNLTRFVDKNGHDSIVMDCILIVENPSLLIEFEYNIIKQICPSLNSYKNRSLLSKEAKQAIKKAKKASLVKTANGGTAHTEEHKKKISEAMPKKRVAQFLNGDKIQEFDSVTSALYSLGKKAGFGHICAACKGKIKQAYGYVWKYID